MQNNAYLYSTIKPSMNSMENSEEIRKKAFNLYMKNWRKNNPDKVKKNNINYWIRRALKENNQGNERN